LPAKVVPRYAVPSPKIVHKPVVVKTPAPPAPRLFSNKIKDIKTSKGMPVKAVTAAPQTQPSKKGAVKTMPVKTIKEPKEGIKPSKPKEIKTPSAEKREMPEFKKDDGKVQIPERKRPVPQKEGEIKTRPKKELNKREDISEPKKIEKKERPIKKKQRIDDDEIKKQPFEGQPKDLKREQRGKERGPH
ncbi:MAG: hypothetical protein HZA00_07760, partial [Nitrospinae bacterium]|nr:hypothetical protein [Nitrospinota bacterium]